jgi:hypothetical protein
MSENLTDDQFLPLVAALAGYPAGEGEAAGTKKYVVLFRPDSGREQEWMKASRLDASLPGLIVFQAIASKFPEFGTTDELIGKYRALTAEKARPDFVPNLDGPEAVSVSAERALHSYKTLLCKRCFLYDCPLHSDPPVEEPVPRLQEHEELALPAGPCGKDCFRHLPGALATLSPRTPRPGGKRPAQPLLRPELAEELNPLRHGAGADREVWSPAEETFYRILAKSFPTNWCAIAQTMITKKCRQVRNTLLCTEVSPAPPQVYRFSTRQADPEPRVKRPRPAVGKQSKQKKVRTKQLLLGMTILLR